MNDEFVNLATAASPFEAHNLAAVLAELEIECRVLDAVDADVPLEQAYQGVPLLVRPADLDRARVAIAQAGVDWDEVDVGMREDDLPLRRPGRMPIAARIGFVVAVVVILMAAAVAVFSILGP